MKRLRPHHTICISKLYLPILLFSQDETLYYNCIRKELELNSNLRHDQLDDCKFTWGTIYSRDVMEILSNVIIKGKFIVSDNICDSICHVCPGRVANKCVGEDKIQAMDEKATDVLNLQVGTIINVKDIPVCTDIKRVCDICGSRSKCDLIIRSMRYL